LRIYHAYFLIKGLLVILFLCSYIWHNISTVIDIHVDDVLLCYYLVV